MLFRQELEELEKNGWTHHGDQPCAPTGGDHDAQLWTNLSVTHTAEVCYICEYVDYK